MSYIGKVELKASDIRTSGVLTISGVSTNEVTLGGSVPSVQTVVLTVNGVTQATNTYTISGSTLTLASGNFADGDTVEAITINDIGTTITPADGTVTSAKIADSSVTLPKLSSGTGTTGQYLKTDGSATLSWADVGVDNNRAANSITIDSTGAVTKPLTPAFFAYVDTQVDNVTGDNTLYGPIVYGTEVFDQGGDYNTANGTFTAPVAGRYFLQAALATGENTAAHTDGTFELITSNRTVNVYYDPGAMEGSGSTGVCTIQCSGVFDMDAADTVITKVRIFGSTKTIDIPANHTWFSAVLVA